MSIVKQSDFCWLCDGDKKSRLEDLKSQIEPILGINLFPHFTDHSVEHSNRLIDIVNKLIGAIQTTQKKILDEELFILYAACYLHDIGMCFEKTGNTKTFNDLKGQQEWLDLSDESRREFIREYHHKISAELVFRSSPQNDRPIGIQLNRDDKPDYIASLCEAHGISVESDEYEKLIKEFPNIRLPLLSGLLRLADILDESRRRADPAKARVLELDIIAQTHWWRHYYTDDIEVEQGFIRINFDFPKGCEKEYGEVIPLLQVPWIENEISKHSIAFNKVGLAWTVETKILDKSYTVAEKMPESVISEMLTKLHLQNVLEAEKKKMVVMQSFRQARPYINRRISELKSNENKISKQEYLRKLWEISKDLYKMGAKRSAYFLSQGDFCKLSTELQPDEQINMGLWLMGIMKEDGHSKETLSVLSKIEEVVKELANSDKRKEDFFKLKVQILIDVADFKGSVEAINNAVELFKQGEMVEELKTQLSELYLLQGEPNNALELLKDGSIIESNKSFTRKFLVKCRIFAMKGEIDRALQELKDVFISTDIKLDPLDQLSILMLQAEILYLDGRGKESFELFENKILSLLNSISQIDQDRKMVIEDNYYETAVHQLKEGSLQNYYQHSDLRNLSGFRLKGSDNLVSAYEYAEEGRHYDALPIFWRQLLKSYYLGSWDAFQRSSNRFAIECLKLNALDMAAYYSIITMNEKIAEKIGPRLLAIGDKNLIKNTVEKVINYSHLFKYSGVACKIIEGISDAIPNDQVESVFQWLYQRCKFTPNDLTETGNFINACSALRSLVLRLNSEQIQKVIQLIISHDIWKSKLHFRNYLIKILYGCVGRLSSTELSRIVRELLPLATSLKSDFDYADVINLLGYIAEKVESHVKDEIANTLYPSDTSKTNIILAKAAEKFGRSVRFNTDLKKRVEDMANNIRLQVQHLNKNEEPKPVLEMYFTFISPIGDKKTVVNAVGTTNLKYLTTQSKLLTNDMVRLLSEAILEMISETDNIINNKIALIDSLKELSMKFSKSVSEKVFNVLESIILGKIGGGIFENMSKEASNPMNPYKINLGSSTELKGYALYALAYMEKLQPGLFNKKLDPLMGNALLDVDPEIRKHAFAASKIVPELSDQALIGVLIGTRDFDDEAAIWAFDSIISKKNQKFSMYHFHLLYYSIVMAAKSQNMKLRQMAANVIKNFSGILPTTVASKITEIKRELINDVCYSVRSVLE